MDVQAFETPDGYIEGLGEGPIDLARAKLEWARFRLRELDSIVNSRVRDAGHPIYIEMRHDRTGRLFWSPASVGEHFGLRVGEINHSLRSAPDVLVWGFSDAPEEIKGPRPGFPIFDDTDEYEQRGRAQVRGLPQVGRQIVASNQPFRWPQGAPEADPLSMLNRLNVIDKHRAPHAVVIGLEVDRAGLDEFIERIRPLLVEDPRISQPDDVLLPNDSIIEFKLRTAGLGGVDFAELVVPRRVDIAFHNRVPVMETLSEIGIRVEGVIHHFSSAVRRGKLHEASSMADDP